MHKVQIQTSNKQETPKTDLQNEHLRVYTSYSQQIPPDLSYQAIKLANFIELELADLEDTLQRITNKNFTNIIKDCLSKSYNVFHQMEKLYKDLGMNFLYTQTKKLISSYGVIFAHLIGIAERAERFEQVNFENGETTKSFQKKQSFEQKIKQNIENSKLKKFDKQAKEYKRQKGIHLFNQSYQRCIDYDIQSFRQMRDKIKQQLGSQAEKEQLLREKQKKFKQEIIDEINDRSHATNQGEELYLFLNKERSLSQFSKTQSLEDELQKIAGFFKQSQHQALQFLRKEKYLESFHELTEGFNVIIDDHKNIKQHQILMVKNKIKQFFDSIRNLNEELEAQVVQKQIQIQGLKLLLAKNDKCQVNHTESQTFYNFDQEIKMLSKKLIESTVMNEQLQAYIKKANEQDRKQNDNLMNELSKKQLTNKKIKGMMEDKNNELISMSKKLKIMTETIKNKNIQDPINFFKNLTEETQRIFVEEIQSQGLIPKGQIQTKIQTRIQQRIITKRNTRHSFIKRDSFMFSPQRKNDDEDSQSGDQIVSKRQNSFKKRGTSNFGNTKEPHPSEDKLNHKRKSDLSSFVPEQNLAPNDDGLSQDKQEVETYKRAAKQTSMKNKKVISVRPVQNEPIQKVRVFEVQQKNSFAYSQKSLSHISSDKIEMKSISSLHPNRKQQSHQETLLFLSQKSEKDFGNQKQQFGKKLSEKNINNKQSMNNTEYNNKRFATQGGNCIDQNLREIKNQNSSNKYEKGKEKQNNQSISFAKQLGKTTLKQKQVELVAKKGNRKTKNGAQTRNNELGIVNQDGEMEYDQNEDLDNEQNMSVTQTQAQNSERINQFKHCQDYSQHPLNFFQIQQSIKQQKRQKCQIINSVNVEINFSHTEDMSNRNKQFQEFFQQKENQHNKTIGISFKKHDKEDQNQKNRRMALTNSENKRKTINDSLKKSEIGSLCNTLETDNQKTKTKISKNETISIFYKPNQTHERGKQKYLIHGRDRQKRLDLSTSYNKQNMSMNGIGGKSKIKKDQRKQWLSLLEDQFGDQQIARASREALSVEEFREKVIKIHIKKCGKECQHLQRYLQIFLKLQLQLQSKKPSMKIHIENLNDKLINYEYENLNLPNIKRQ